MRTERRVMLAGDKHVVARHSVALKPAVKSSTGFREKGWALVGGAGLAATTSAYDGGGASYAGGAPKGCGVHGVGGCRRREGVGGGDGGGGSAMVL